SEQGGNMGFRRFTDRDKLSWEIRPVGENTGKPRTVASPGYEKDPYELSQEELQRLLDGAAAAPVRRVRNPFE
ncbi:MAG TPA: hypothetical protein VIQ98_00120, partial [Gemmatimonadales bacterium]